jgi:predicted transcriptional regulator
MRLNFILRVLVILLLSTIFSTASVLAELQGTKGLADTTLKSMMTKLDSIGFIATAKNEHIENHYYNKYKE